MTVKVVQTNCFRRQKKKLAGAQLVVLDMAVKKISKNPVLGVSKKGDLQQVRVYKFKAGQQQLLLAYIENICLLGVSVITV